MAKKKTKKNVSTETAVEPKKRSYASATSRVLNNLHHMTKCSSLIRSRFASWLASLPPGKDHLKLLGKLESLDTIEGGINSLVDDLHKFFDTFEPPNVVKKTIIEVGDTVKIAKKYRSRYEGVYESNLNYLKVESVEGRCIVLIDEETGAKFMVQGRAHLAHTKNKAED